LVVLDGTTLLGTAESGPGGPEPGTQVCGVNRLLP
jgi:hypothetical protein